MDDDDDDDDEIEPNSSNVDRNQNCAKTITSDDNEDHHSKPKKKKISMSDSMIFEKAGETYLKAFTRQVSKLKQLSDKIVFRTDDNNEQIQNERLKTLLSLLTSRQQQSPFGKRKVRDEKRKMKRQQNNR